ncbi:MAG: histidine kinase [Luteolibacter sp.]|uniref:histidine kinase n=1 Tax=Luteolibacter sp. TaxID=1962973 RepID=UPI003265D823
MKIPWLLLAMLCCSGLSSGADLPASQVRPIREIQTAATVEPFEQSEVIAEGVVTWVEAGAGPGFYIQDSSGGLLVTRENGPGPKVAERVRIRGTLSRGDFAPVIRQAEYQSLGPGGMPNVVRASGGGLLNGSFNGERVETDGWIRSAEMIDATTMVGLLDSGASRISFRINNVKTLKPEKLIAGKAWVRGVASPARSRGTIRQLVEVQLLANGEEDFRWEQRETASPWTLPPTPLRNAFQYHPAQTRGERLHVRGKVVMVADGIAWLHDGEAGLAMRRADAVKVSRGDQVEVVGFRDLEDFLPVLSDAVIRPDNGAEIVLQPKQLQAAALREGLHHGDFVSVTGHLLDRIDAPIGSADRRVVLALQSDRGVFTAELDARGSGVLGHLETGSLLRVTGICSVQTDMTGETTGFKMLVPDAASIAVVEAAPYFTPRRLLVLLSITLAILLAAALWAYFLAQRNLRLRAEMRERLAVSAERSRLACDLHDTLEQGLTAIHLQLHAIGPSPQEASGETQERVGAARRLVQQCHSEIRRSIWNLRSEALEHFDLGDALHRAAQSLFLGSRTRAIFRQQKGERKIPQLIGDNVLKIGQEAITNVLKHANASVLRIDLTTTNDLISLAISDDGNGFTPSTAPDGSTGHFGLMGMGERAERIGGKLDVSSQPGEGTTIRIEVPLTHPSS